MGLLRDVCSHVDSATSQLWCSAVQYEIYSLTGCFVEYTLGKPGLERHFRHPTTDAVVKLQFITNKVRLKGVGYEFNSPSLPPIYFYPKINP